ARGRVDPTTLDLASCEERLRASPRTAASLDAHLQCLLGIDVATPPHPRVYAEVSRTLYLRGVGWPSPDRDDLAAARGWALRCLALQPGVAGRLRASGGRITEDVVDAVFESEVDCLVWGAMAWARWIDRQGAAGVGIDLEPVQLLADRAAELAPDWDEGRPRWAVALARGVVPPALGRDAEQVAAAFAQARQDGGDRLMLRVDEARFVAAPAGDLDGWRRRLETVADAPVDGQDLDAYEDLAAVAVAARRLAAGPPPPSVWMP
ncbi:MAG: hypothetical protein D6798_13385, partial [Deltaproteobacteria bacterium]